MPPLQISDLTFLFNIVPVKIREPGMENRGGGIAGQHWYPPITREEFLRVDSESTGWCRWSASTGVQEGVIPGNAPDDNDDVYTVFFDQEVNHFLIVPLDCSRDSIQRFMEADPLWAQPGWFRVMFRHLNNRRLSELSHIHEEWHLGGRGSPEWVPQLLPVPYEDSTSNVTTGLIGKLCLLVAIAAFTSEFERAQFLKTMTDHFQPPRWRPRPNITPSVKLFPRSHEYGLIVRIRPDPNSRIGRAELNAFEGGRCGALIR